MVVMFESVVLLEKLGEEDAFPGSTVVLLVVCIGVLC